MPGRNIGMQFVTAVIVSLVLWLTHANRALFNFIVGSIATIYCVAIFSGSRRPHNPNPDLFVDFLGWTHLLIAFTAFTTGFLARYRGLPIADTLYPMSYAGRCLMIISLSVAPHFKIRTRSRRTWILSILAAAAAAGLVTGWGYLLQSLSGPTMLRLAQSVNLVVTVALSLASIAYFCIHRGSDMQGLQRSLAASLIMGSLSDVVFFVVGTSGGLLSLLGHIWMLTAIVTTYFGLIVRSAERNTLAQMEQLRLDAQSRQQLIGMLVMAEEHGRLLVSRELHDEIGQLLTRLLMVADRGARGGQTDPGEIRDLAHTALEATRRLSKTLRPPALDDLGLFPAIQNHIDEFQRTTEIPVTAQIIGPDYIRFMPEVEINFYRAVQETLTNVARHSQADRVSVVVAMRDGMLTGVIEDDGLGFVPDASHRGVGLTGIAERMALVGGQFSIESRPGHGTTVFIRVPAKVVDGECVS